MSAGPAGPRPPLPNISTLAGERPLAWFDEHGWQLDVLDRMRVRLNVNAVASAGTPEARVWCDCPSARGAVPAEEERGYRLRHELRMYARRASTIVGLGQTSPFTKPGLPRRRHLRGGALLVRVGDVPEHESRRRGPSGDKGAVVPGLRWVLPMYGRVCSLGRCGAAVCGPGS
jgi:hypothetical protein